jgi:hypothetical protein
LGQRAARTDSCLAARSRRARQSPAPPASRSPDSCLVSLIPTAPSPGPKPTLAVRAPRLSLPGRLRRREHDHGKRHPSSPLTVLRPWSVELTLPSLLAIVRPQPATVAPPCQRDAAAEPDFFSSLSTRSFGELAFRPPCPAGSLTVVGAQPPPFAPSLPLWRRRWPCRDTRVGAVTAPACAALRRVVAGRAGRGRPSERRPRPRGCGPRTRCSRGPSRRRGHGPGATVHLGRAWFRPRGTQIDFSIF